MTGQATASTSGASTNWLCTACTLPNSPELRNCYACASKKPEQPSAAFLQKTSKSGTYRVLFDNLF